MLMKMPNLNWRISANKTGVMVYPSLERFSHDHTGCPQWANQP